MWDRDFGGLWFGDHERRPPNLKNLPKFSNYTANTQSKLGNVIIVESELPLIILPPTSAGSYDQDTVTPNHLMQSKHKSLNYVVDLLASAIILIDVVSKKDPDRPHMLLLQITSHALEYFSSLCTIIITQLSLYRDTNFNWLSLSTRLTVNIPQFD